MKWNVFVVLGLLSSGLVFAEPDTLNSEDDLEEMQSILSDAKPNLNDGRMKDLSQILQKYFPVSLEDQRMGNPHAPLGITALNGLTGVDLVRFELHYSGLVLDILKAIMRDADRIRPPVLETLIFAASDSDVRFEAAQVGLRCETSRPEHFKRIGEFLSRSEDARFRPLASKYFARAMAVPGSCGLAMDALPETGLQECTRIAMNLDGFIYTRPFPSVLGSVMQILKASVSFQSLPLPVLGNFASEILSNLGSTPAGFSKEQRTAALARRIQKIALERKLL